MPFKIDTQTKGVFLISEESITRLFFQSSKTSKGLLVTKHYQEIHRALYCAWILRESKCYESIAAYYHKDEDLKDAPPLEKIIPAMERQVDLLSDGAYNKYADFQKTKDWTFIHSYRYWREIQDIWVEIDALKSGRYYENKLHHRPGVPRIETIGQRLVDAIVNLVWRLDSEKESIQEEVDAAAFRKVNEQFPGSDEKPLWKEPESSGH